MEQNININGKKSQKKRIIIMVVLIIIANILLISFIELFYYKKIESKDKEINQAIIKLQNQTNESNTNTTDDNVTKDTIKKDDYEKLSINDSTVVSLHENLKECEGFIFKTGGFNSKNIPNDLKIQLAFFKLLKEEKYSNKTRNVINDYGTYSIESKVFKNSDMKLACREILGDSDYTNNEIKTWFLNTKYEDVRTLTYDVLADEYIGDIIQGGGGYKVAKDFVIEARKYEDKIEIYAKEYYYGVGIDAPTVVYSDYDYTSTDYYGDNLKNLLKSYEENVFSEDLVKSELSDKLHTVKYTYTLNDDGTGNYYFSGFERMS